MRRGWTWPAVVMMVLAAEACADSPTEADAALAPAGGLAQEADGRRFRPGGAILAHRDALGLTDDQVAAIRDVLDELEAANAPLLEQLRALGRPSGDAGADPARRALVEQIRDNNRSARERIAAVLTAAQREQLEQLRQQRPEGRRHPGGHDGFGPGADRLFGALARLSGELALTDEQRASMRAIADELREKNRPLLEQLKESGERPFGPDAASNPLIQQLRANLAAAREQVLALLTAEQKAALEELRQQRQRRGRRGQSPGGG